MAKLKIPKGLKIGLAILLGVLVATLAGLTLIGNFGADSEEDSAQKKALSRLSALKATDYFTTQPEVEFANAIAEGNVDKMKSALQNGININTVGKDGISFLCWSFLKFNKPSYRFLLENGADPNGRHKDFPVMVFAVKASEPVYLQLALEHSGDANLINPESQEPILFDAITSRSIENIQLLIKYRANVNAQNASGETPLMDAATLNLFDFCKVLINAGADPTIKDSWNVNALETILDKKTLNNEGMEKRNEVIALLRDKGYITN